MGQLKHRLVKVGVVALNDRAAQKIVHGDLKGSIKDLNQAIKLDPNYAPLYQNRVLAKSKLGDKKGALLDYAELARLDLYANPSLALVQFDVTVRDCDQLLSKRPSCFIVACRALLKDQKGDALAAIEDLSEAIHLAPQNPRYILYRAQLKRKMGDAQGASEDMHEYLLISPDACLDAL